MNTNLQDQRWRVTHLEFAMAPEGQAVCLNPLAAGQRESIWTGAQVANIFPAAELLSDPVGMLRHERSPRMFVTFRRVR